MSTFTLMIVIFVVFAIFAYSLKRWETEKESILDKIEPDTEPNRWDGYLSYFDTSKINDIFAYPKEVMGEDAFTAVWIIILILIVSWIIGTIFNYFTRDPKKEPLMKLGTSGGLLITLLLFLLLFFLIHQIFFKEDKDKIRSEVSVEINKLRVGGSVTVPMSLTTVAKVTIDMTKPRQDGIGKSFWACPEVVKPERVTDFVFFEPFKKSQSFIHYVRITDISKKHLLDYGTMQVEVKFTKILAGNRPEDNPCPFLKY